MNATFSVALEETRWEAVSLYLVLGVIRAATVLPPETVESLLELLERPRPHSRRNP